MLILLTFVVSAVLAIVSYYHWQLDYWKRRGISGPPGTIFLGNWYSTTNPAMPIGLVLREWTKVYGKVFGIQEGLRRTLVISDIEMIRELFVKKFDYFYARKHNVIAGDAENEPRVHVFEAQGVRWKRLRTIASPAFSSSSLRKIHPTVESSALALMEFFEQEAGKKAFNILPYYKEFTVDVIHRVAMGQQGPRLFTDKDKVARIEYVFRISHRNPVFLLAAVIPSLRLTLRKLFIAVAPLRKSPVPEVFQQIYKTIDDRIEKRARNDTSSVETSVPTDFIDLFLDARAEQDLDNSAEFSKSGIKVTKQLTRDEIAAQCFVFLLAGFDTTANSLAYVTYLLAKNPRVQRTLQEEIDQHCNPESIDYEIVSSLKYMDCVIKEALRMYPIANFANSRRCVKSTTLGDVQINEGDFVMADTFSVHFSREIWGEDVDEFRPERWLESSDRPQAAFLAFGLGPRLCIGMRLAYLEEKLVLAHLLQRYSIVATADTEESLSLRGSMTVSPMAVTVQLERRQK